MGEAGRKFRIMSLFCSNAEAVTSLLSGEL
jgi:hypothetical protein